MKAFSVALLTTLLIFLSYGAQSAVWVITYPQPTIESDTRYEYPLALLRLALDKTSVRYQLKPSATAMRQARSLKRLEENLEVNVFWSMTDAVREEQLRPIRIPIDKGLIGWRMFLAPKGSPFLTTRVERLSDLLNYEPVQGIAWPDTKILQANGFNVATARDYTEAEQMVSAGLADFFPRSVIEIEAEMQNDPESNLVLRRDLALQYPSAMYFFVNKRNITLANLIETGLERAIADGSFDALFEAHFGETIAAMNLRDVRYFTLANPLLPKLTPTSRKELWYKPEK